MDYGSSNYLAGKDGANKAFGKPEISISYAKINAVYPDNRKVDVIMINSTAVIKDIPYIFPIMNTSGGIDFAPSKGDIAIVAMTSIGSRIVLGFSPSGTRDDNFKMMEGDLILKSKQGSVLKVDSAGNIFIIDENGNTLSLSPKDGVSLISSGNMKIASRGVSEDAIFDGGLSYQKDFYNTDMALLTSIEEALEYMSSGQSDNIVLEDRFPFASIQAGKIIENGLQLKMDVNGIMNDVVLRFGVRDDATGDFVSSIMMDKHGNINLKGKLITIDGDDMRIKTTE